MPPEVWKTWKFYFLLLWFCNTIYKQIERWTKSYILRIIRNYWGITLTSIVAKVCNALILNCITPEIEKILWKSQNGLSVILEEFPSKFLKCSFQFGNLSSWLAAFSFALEAFFLLLTSFTISHSNQWNTFSSVEYKKIWWHTIIQHCINKTQQGNGQKVVSSKSLRITEAKLLLLWLIRFIIPCFSIISNIKSRKF